jgi:hypothetical protein
MNEIYNNILKMQNKLDRGPNIEFYAKEMGAIQVYVDKILREN